MWTKESYTKWLIANPERRREIDRMHRTRNHTTIRERETAFHTARPLYSAVKRAKQRAKLLCLPFDLDDRLIHCPRFCPALGLQLRYGPNTGGLGPDSPSIDRVYPALGYVIGNVRVISHRANTIKSDASAEELEKVLAYVKSA